MKFVVGNAKSKTEIAIILVFLSFFYACSKGNVQPLPFSTEFPMAVAQKTFKAEIALDDAEKARGLMFRESLDSDSSMLFVYESPRRASFWMRNTYIPLDIAFIDSKGTITEIRKMYPRDENSVTSARSDIKYCLETNASWFERNGISVGDRLDLNLLKRAVNARTSR